MEPCELHGVAGCSICSGLDKRLAQEDRGLTTHARFGGKCSQCGEWYEPRQQLTSRDGVWICRASDFD